MLTKFTGFKNLSKKQEYKSTSWSQPWNLNVILLIPQAHYLLNNMKQKEEMRWYQYDELSDYDHQIDTRVQCTNPDLFYLLPL